MRCTFKSNHLILFLKLNKNSSLKLAFHKKDGKRNLKIGFRALDTI